jgi:hypothetical protein
MAQSPEYPDLRWMPPKSWTDANRSSVQLIVIHTTEGSAHGQSAEDGASYDQRRTDGTSTHYFVDSDSVVQCVRTADQAHTARSQGNRRGIQNELCGRTTLDWGGAYAQAMLRRAAKQAARDAKKWGIPVRKLSPSQVADGMKGFCGHADITYAFPQDGGTHTDPGKNFPWSQFLGMVQAELTPEVTVDLQDVKDIWTTDGFIAAPANAASAASNPFWTPASFLKDTSEQTRAIAADLADMKAALAAILARVGVDQVDEQAIVAGVLAGLDPAAIAAAIPAELAEQVANELAARLAS